MNLVPSFSTVYSLHWTLFVFHVLSAQRTLSICLVQHISLPYNKLLTIFSHSYAMPRWTWTHSVQCVLFMKIAPINTYKNINTQTKIFTLYKALNLHFTLTGYGYHELEQFFSVAIDWFSAIQQPFASFCSCSNNLC